MPVNATGAAYAEWTQPGTQFSVSYSLPVFHEIDFQVNEGFRRIPHGGIEVGGLLFGHLTANSARIEAFRNIECEHASGPSFVLSERDLAAMREQLANAASDPELEGLAVIGWFIAHTRSELRMNEREIALFDEFFPAPGEITILIKPERFQPTRFGFVIRGADGHVEPEASQNAVILPLPGRGDRGAETESVSALPAPARSTRPTSIGRDVARDTEREWDAAPPPPAVPTEPRVREAVSEMPSPKTASNRFSTAMSRERLAPEGAPQPSRVGPDHDPATSTAGALVSARTLTPLEEIRRSRPLELQRRALDPRDHQYQLRPPEKTGRGLNFRIASALIVAALLGCALGYWAVQQLSPSPIPLTVEPKASTLVVSWPAEETRSAQFAALRVDDQSAMPLTPEQKTAGEAEIGISGDNLKVELIVPHRMGDARGIIRYVRAAQLVAPPQRP